MLSGADRPDPICPVSGIGHGARVRLIAANRNVVIACNDMIRTRDGADLALAENAVVEFLRTREGVLRQI